MSKNIAAAKRLLVFETVLTTLGGWYLSLDREGARKGPMVGYAATYKQGDETFQLIGDLYCNCRVLDQSPKALRRIVKMIIPEIKEYIQNSKLENICVVGVPSGGIMPAQHIADFLGCNFAALDKKVIALATPTLRQQEELVLSTYAIPKGSEVFIVEDVGNNFSSTGKTITLLENLGYEVVGIICLFNRNPKGIITYDNNDVAIPIFSVAKMALPEYRQDDPNVADYIKIPGNLVLKPKSEWKRLQQMMSTYCP